MPSYSKLIQSIMRENFTEAKKEFSSLVAEKMQDIVKREYKETGHMFAKEQAPPQQDSYVEEVSTDEPEDDLEAIKKKAQDNSRNGYVQHVNKTPYGHRISDWYDGDDTVASYENGRQLSENEIMKLKRNEEVSTDEPSNSSNMEQMDDPELGIRAREVVGEKGARKV